MPAKKTDTNPVIKPLAKHRWFIWTIVIVTVIGVGLSAYIYISTINDEAEFNASPTPSVSKPSEY